MNITCKDIDSKTVTDLNRIRSVTNVTKVEIRGRLPINGSTVNIVMCVRV